MKRRIGEQSNKTLEKKGLDDALYMEIKQENLQEPLGTEHDPMEVDSHVKKESPKKESPKKVSPKKTSPEKVSPEKRKLEKYSEEGPIEKRPKIDPNSTNFIQKLLQATNEKGQPDYDLMMKIVQEMHTDMKVANSEMDDKFQKAMSAFAPKNELNPTYEAVKSEINDSRLGTEEPVEAIKANTASLEVNAEKNKISPSLSAPEKKPTDDASKKIVNLNFVEAQEQALLKKYNNDASNPEYIKDIRYFYYSILDSQAKLNKSKKGAHTDEDIQKFKDQLLTVYSDTSEVDSAKISPQVAAMLKSGVIGAKLMEELLEQLSTSYDYIFAKLNSKEKSDSAMRYELQNISDKNSKPTLLPRHVKTSLFSVIDLYQSLLKKFVFVLDNILQDTVSQITNTTKPINLMSASINEIRDKMVLLIEYYQRNGYSLETSVSFLEQLLAQTIKEIKSKTKDPLTTPKSQEVLVATNNQDLLLQTDLKKILYAFAESYTEAKDLTASPVKQSDSSPERSKEESPTQTTPVASNKQKNPNEDPVSLAQNQRRNSLEGVAQAVSSPHSSGTKKRKNSLEGVTKAAISVPEEWSLDMYFYNIKYLEEKGYNRITPQISEDFLKQTNISIYSPEKGDFNLNDILPIDSFNVKDKKNGSLVGNHGKGNIILEKDGKLYTILMRALVVKPLADTSSTPTPLKDGAYTWMAVVLKDKLGNLSLDIRVFKSNIKRNGSPAGHPDLISKLTLDRHPEYEFLQNIPLYQQTCAKESCQSPAVVAGGELYFINGRLVMADPQTGHFYKIQNERGVDIEALLELLLSSYKADHLKTFKEVYWPLPPNSEDIPELKQAKLDRNGYDCYDILSDDYIAKATQIVKNSSDPTIAASLLFSSAGKLAVTLGFISDNTTETAKPTQQNDPANIREIGKTKP